MASAKDIRFDQRNVTNTAYQEKYVNGNSLILRTDSTGSVIGTSTLEGVAIGTLTSSKANFTNVTASVISSSVFIGSLSGSLSGSSIITNNLTALNSNLTNVTSSNISASGYISASAANFNTLNSNSSILFNVTASNITASGYISASTVNTTNLVSVNNILTNVTSSNISASGNTELGTLSVKGSTVLYGDLTVFGTSSVVNISSSTVIIGDNRIQLNAWSTGSFSQRYAGLDLTATSIDDDSYGNIIYGTGLAIEIPEGHVGLLYPRSSNSKTDLYLTNHVGVIDSGYRGFIMAKLDNLGSIDYEVKKGSRLCQICAPDLSPLVLNLTSDLSKTTRGEAGFGSTG